MKDKEEWHYLLGPFQSSPWFYESKLICTYRQKLTSFGQIAGESGIALDELGYILIYYVWADWDILMSKYTLL